jgi:ribosomal protein L14
MATKAQVTGVVVSDKMNKFMKIISLAPEVL